MYFFRFGNLLTAVTVRSLTEVHREAKLGLNGLYASATIHDDNQEINAPLQSGCVCYLWNEVILAFNSPYTDIYGTDIATVLRIVHDINIECARCGRKSAATKYAPHLEKCMGLGRQSSRSVDRTDSL